MSVICIFRISATIQDIYFQSVFITCNNAGMFTHLRFQYNSKAKEDDWKTIRTVRVFYKVLRLIRGLGWRSG